MATVQFDASRDDKTSPCVIPAKVYLNNKGGVGKTTNSSLDAEYSATVKGQRVLLIDWDGQMNLTAHWIGVDADSKGNLMTPIHPDIDPDDEQDKQLYSQRSSIIDIFYGKEVLPHPTYIGPEDIEDMESPRVDIIAGSREGMYQLQHNLDATLSHGVINEAGESTVKGYSTRQLIQRLAEFCANPELGRYYDQIIIDAGPSDTPLFRAAIQAATHIVTPYKPEEYSFMGITTLVNNILSANSNRMGRTEKVKFIGLLPCMVDRGRGGFHEDYILSAMDDFKHYHFPEGYLLINSKKISSRQSKIDLKPDSVFKLRPSDPIRKDCETVFDYVHQEVFS